MTNKNKPKLRIVAGSVKKINKGFTVIRNKPKAIATYIADSGFARLTPGKKCANINTAIAVKTILRIIFMCYFLLLFNCHMCSLLIIFLIENNFNMLSSCMFI